MRDASCTHVVLYSPSLGATGLDLDIQLTRSEVYEKEAPGSISLSESDRNIGVFSPEEHLYHLSSIKRGISLCPPNLSLKYPTLTLSVC